MRVCALGQPHRDWAVWAPSLLSSTHAHPLQGGRGQQGVRPNWIKEASYKHKQLMPVHNFQVSFIRNTWCCCWCFIYRFYPHIIGNHTRMCAVCAMGHVSPGLCHGVRHVTSCSVSRMSGVSWWQHLAMTRDHWPHPLPLQPPTALQPCSQALHSDHVRKVTLDRE